MIGLVSIACVGCDQSTKSMASQHLSRDGMDSYFHDFLRLGYTENFGGFLGMGNRLPEEYRFILFTVVVGAFLSLFLFYLVLEKSLKIFSLAALSLVFAGGSSNFFDRTTNYGAVIDFLNVGFGSVRTGIFNVADMAILAGCLFYFLAQSLDHKVDS